MPTDSLAGRPSIVDMNDEEFIDRLAALGRDWRYSNEFIGSLVRSRYPKDTTRGRERCLKVTQRPS